MPTRKYPIARVRLYEPGRRYAQRADGFGRYDVAADLWRSGQLTSSTVDPSVFGIGAGVGNRAQVPAAMILDEKAINVTVCRPFLDTAQSIGLDCFDLHGGQWLPLEGLGMGSEVRLYQYDGQQSGGTGAVSKFALPRNPVFCVSLHRTDPSPEHDWSSDPPCTEIQLGVGSDQEWSIVLPYGGGAFLMQRRNGAWERVPNAGRSTSLRSLEGYGPGDRLLLWIAVWRGKLVVSTDGFADDIWVSPSGPGEVEIPQGKVALWHNAGQWAFSLIPVKMATATVDSSPIEAGYDTLACSGDLLLQARSSPVLGSLGEVLADVDVVDSTDLRSDLTDFQRAWRASLAPYTYSDPTVSFETSVSPELHGVQIGQFAEIVDTGEQSWSEISDDIESAEGEAGNDGRASLFRLRIDNSLGQHANLSEYRRCGIEIGWMLESGATEYEKVIDGYLVEPEPAILPGPRDKMEAVVIDPVLRLRDEKCDGRTPVFDGWAVADVFAWVLDRCGVPSAMRDLEDTGTVLSSGAFDRPLWQVEPGRSWGEFLREVADFDYRAAVFSDCDGKLCKACRFCRQKRTPADVAQHDGNLGGPCVCTVLWELYTRSALAGGPGTGEAILSIERPRLSLHTSEFTNYVAVCGLAADGTPVRSIVFEPASLYDPASDAFVGWRKMTVAALETYTDQSETNRLAEELFRDGAQRPEHIVIVTPLEPGMSVGDVVRVNGGERLGVDGQKYRVERLRQTIRRAADEPATTEIVARWLREEE